MDWVILLVAFGVGGFAGASAIIYWWRQDRKEVDKYVAGLEKELHAYKMRYFVIKHHVDDGEPEFGTLDGGLSWYHVITLDNGSVRVYDQLLPDADGELIHELNERIVLIANPDAEPTEEMVCSS